jgi:redox-sensitive bicupin YhaK (pirin superfamily)
VVRVSAMEIQIRRANERGGGDHGWLKTSHSFSFADYYDPQHMGFRVLRVINEDFVEPGRGFGTHPHNDMEIVTYVLDGELMHKDSMGNGSVIRPGEVQRMSAGTGVTHSEANPSKTQPVHLLQIWIMPDRPGHKPSYEQKMFPPEERRGKLRVVASPDGRDGSVSLNQNATLESALLQPGEKVEHKFDKGRFGWVQVARGEVEIDGKKLVAGDGAAIKGEGSLPIKGVADSEVLVFDLP